MKWLTDQINRIPQPWKVIGFCVIGVIIVLLLWFYGTRMVNGVSSWWYSRGTNAAHEEIDKAKAEAAQSKQIAAEALAALEQEKKITETERQKRQIAEEILSDKSKNTDAKIRAYEDAMRGAPLDSGPANTDQLCERAKALGVVSECGN